MSTFITLLFAATARLSSFMLVFVVVTSASYLTACGQERAPIAHSVINGEAAKPVDKKPSLAEASECIDVSKINPNRMCTMDFRPVCGCDGKTHSNPCGASSAGVTTWVEGECPAVE